MQVSCLADIAANTAHSLTSVHARINTHKVPSFGPQKHRAEKSRHLKVSDMCRATIETLPLM